MCILRNSVRTHAIKERVFSRAIDILPIPQPQLNVSGSDSNVRDSATTIPMDDPIGQNASGIDDPSLFGGQVDVPANRLTGAQSAQKKTVKYYGKSHLLTWKQK